MRKGDESGKFYFLEGGRESAPRGGWIPGQQRCIRVRTADAIE